MNITTDRPDRLRQTCPSCGRELRIPVQFIGQQVECRFCAATFLVAPVSPDPNVDGLRYVGTGPAFEIVRSWSGAADEDRRSTFLRHPSKQPLKDFLVAAECYGPATLYLGGLQVKTAQPILLGKVRPGEVRVVLLEEVYHAYFWVRRGERARARLIVARVS